MAKAASSAANKLHYFYKSNPYRTVESIKEFVNQECIYHNENIAAFNKPQNFSFYCK